MKNGDITNHIFLLTFCCGVATVPLLLAINLIFDVNYLLFILINQTTYRYFGPRPNATN